MIWVRVTRVRSSPVLTSTTCTSVSSRTRAAISSRLIYRLVEVSYNLRFPYFLMTTLAGFNTFPLLHCNNFCSSIDKNTTEYYHMGNAAVQQTEVKYA